MASFFTIPTFGSSNSQQGYTSPKTHHSPLVYQPMPAVGTPSFGGLGRPMTPKEPSRHSSYSNKDVEPTIQTIQPSVERTRRHREYYLEGGDIYFLVENYLFRVHRYFFERESPVFRKHFADSALNGHHRLGSSDSEPLALHDVRTDDFSRFLWVFYNPIYSIYDATSEDWAAILGLAHHWQFSEVKKLVVRELEKQIIPSIYKIVIYHRYDVDRGLLLPSYTDLVSREETLSIEEAKDLGLETSLMIMTAREIVRKGEAPTSAVNISPEDLRNIIRQVFRFPGQRSDSPFSDTTAAEPALEPRSPPTLAGKTELPTVPEHENEPITLTTSASLNSPMPPVTETPVTTTSTPPVPASSIQNKPGSFKQPVTPKKEGTKPASASPPKGPKPKDEPTTTTPLPTKKDEPKPSVQEPVKPTTEEPPKPDAQGGRKPFLSRLSDVSKGAGGPASAKDATTPKDKEGDKPNDSKEASETKGTTDTKDAAGLPASGQDPNETPVGTPLLNQDTDRPGTPSTGQSVLGKKARALLTRAGEVKRVRAVQGTAPSNKGKDKEMESLKVPVPSQTGSELKRPETGVKEVGVEAAVDGKGEEKIASGKEDEGRADAEQDAKKPGEGTVNSSDNITLVTTDNTTRPVADVKTGKTNDLEVPSVVIDAAPSLDTTTGDKDTAKDGVNPVIKEEKGEPTVDKGTAKPKEGIEPGEQRAEPVIADEGDFATPKRATKELPASPVKPLKEKLVPALGLVLPKPSGNGSAPASTTTVTGSSLSPLQEVLKNAEDETLMERMARLKIGDAGYQPPKDIVPPPHTDLESEFECETAPSGPSTPRSRGGKGSFNLMLRSDVPLSDDDDFFLDCDSNASVSNFGGV